MYKLLFILTLGVAIGYGYGWKDAQMHDKNVAERIVEQIGGDSRAHVSGDIDAQMRAVETR